MFFSENVFIVYLLIVMMSSILVNF